MTMALEGGEGSASRPGPSYPRERPSTIVQEAGWAPGPVWKGAENFASTRIRSPDRPGRKQSLYRLRYTVHCVNIWPTVYEYATESRRKPNSSTLEIDGEQHDCPRVILSPSSILQSPSSHCAFHPARKNLVRLSKTQFSIFLHF